MFYKIAISAGAASLCAALLLAQNQAPLDEKAKERRAKDIARAFEQNARTLTLFDRQGKTLNTIGQRGMYGNPVLSPDGKRVAVLRPDLEKENQDLWILDVATGNSVQITSGKTREFVISPAWSPDGTQIAYVALRSGSFELLRNSPDGQGKEERLHALGGFATISDWSVDGNYLSFFVSDLGGSVLSALPMKGPGERKPVEIFRSPKQIQGGRLTPDGRLIAYVSNESGKNEVYVRAFDPTGNSGVAGGPWKISEQGGLGMTSWRKDGKEFYFLAADRSLMMSSVSTSPSIAFGKPRVLYRAPDAVAVQPGVMDISRDGERLLIAVPPPQLRQLTMFDREGKAVRTIGEPTVFVVQPHFSPDGTKLAYMKQDPKTSDVDIWTYDLESGKEYAVTRDNWPENAPTWFPDGKRVLYASTRDNYAGIYRKNWDGSGEEELLFRYTPGAGITLTDASPDGKFLTFHTGVLVMVPLAGTDPLARKPIDWLRDEYDNIGAKFSPDGRYVAYLANVQDPRAMDVYVRPFDGSKPDAPPPGEPAQVTKNGIASGVIGWREDGKELYLMTRDFEVMAVDVMTTPEFKAGAPKLLFKLPAPPVGNASQWKNVSRDGQRFVFSMPTR